MPIFGPNLTMCDDFIIRIFCMVFGYHISNMIIPFASSWALFSFFIIGGLGIPTPMTKDDLIHIFILKPLTWLIATAIGFALSKAIGSHNISFRAGMVISLTSTVHLFIILVGASIYYLWLLPWGVIAPIFLIIAAGSSFVLFLVNKLRENKNRKFSKYMQTDAKVYGAIQVPTIIFSVYCLLQLLKLWKPFGSYSNDYMELIILTIIIVIGVVPTWVFFTNLLERVKQERRVNP